MHLVYAESYMDVKLGVELVFYIQNYIYTQLN